MSDAERSGGEQRERLDWGDEESADSTIASGATSPDGVDRSEAAADSPDSDDEADLCVIEDPTCEACQ